MLNNSDASTEMVFEYTARGCAVPKNVTSVRFHPSVVEVENKAFIGYNNLREVVFNDGLQKIGYLAFCGCPSLSSITISSTVTEIGNCAFSGCNNLSEVVFNNGLQKIGWRAFRSCTSLESITLPSTVIEIDSQTFNNCKQLKEVVFDDGLQKIGGYAFSNCTSLYSIKLPSTVTEIESDAFSSCNNLREIILSGIPQEIGKDAFYNCNSLERFTFPTISARLNNLIQTGHWEDIENEVDEVRGVVERTNSVLFVSTQTMGGGRNWTAVRRDLEKIIRIISYYELKEGTSIFELALWKFKLDQVDKANPIPRKKCRMDVPGPVKDIILQYLPYECILPLLDIQSSSSESDDNESSGDDDY